MASKAKITKAVRKRKVDSKKLRRGRRVRSAVASKLTVLKALEVAVSQANK